ncbi:membrane protein insertase YidC [Pelagicoccus sp. SDUM812003]|uniref:membrane protein insertase YidC n=1 Tax=Pelagicoccus sp. SDUM812003 TaxID=3041267 RepID=UPI00280CAD32|nr:membrane protein insertase YidC [Pelagicoccus sp. SDUM812003]MDQ8204267.1 membrane protein insertase YidC [Pelagicoccus sp. SDUM812003]
MDKKNTIIGVALLIVGMVLMTKTSQRQVEPNELPPQTAPEAIPSDQSGPASPVDPSATPPVPSTITPVTNGHAKVEEITDREGEVIASLENDFIEARFTNYGGSIKEIVLKKKKATIDGEDPYIMNRLRYVPALNLSTYLGDAKDVIFERVPSLTPNTVTFRAKLSDQLEITRRYTISEDAAYAAPYTIEHTLEFKNLSDQPLPLGEPSLNIGTVAPSGNQDRYLQTFGYYNGEDVEFTEQSDFSGGGFLFFKSEPMDFEQVNDTVVWASVKNQFFITLLTPGEPGSGFIARPVDFPLDPKTGEPATGITADVKMGAISLPAGGTVTKSFDFYAGPKEHTRLAKLKQGQEQAMQFGFFGAISKILLQLMTWIHGFVGNWGVAIVLLTVVVRGTLLPITLMSMKSMRKMSKLQEPMKALKEKFPDDTQKQQQMMMELYKLNKINPVAGCLPMLAQIPIFFALFYMLRSAAELRFADFLWIADLSKPDTIGYVAGFPFNVLPFFWLVTLAYQMWTMPTPTVDNAQTKMMKFMPFIFFPFTYTFSSGLVLYWSISNLFTIGQQWLTKRGQDDFEVQLPPAMKKAIEGDNSKKKKRKKN